MRRRRATLHRLDAVRASVQEGGLEREKVLHKNLEESIKDVCPIPKHIRLRKGDDFFDVTSH